MKIGAPVEKAAGEARVALTPDSAKQLMKLGHECLIQKGAGKLAGFSDKAYKEAGVSVVSTSKALWADSDVIIKVQKPDKSELTYLDKSKTFIGFFWPGQNEHALKAAKKTGATVIAMDMVPRISRAQKMDALSSMANIAGYRAVIEAGT
ncbi:MAG: NAD(P)(+) transhydrogenase (Re/Si-specific) subunit alpha, partial [Alphaproteobacteria bacterium]|nr:NAD(P)(+) transhydrogenase (Re/Si-specific) subunit alpha [Alphaproteobacteria bacterium]